MTTGLYTPRRPLSILALSTRAATSFFELVKRYWRARQHRREMRDLLSWDAHALKDIGLTPMDVRLAHALPSGVDPTTQLRVFAVERRANERAQAQERARAIEAMRSTSVAKVTGSENFARSAEMQEGKLLEYKRYHL